MQSDGSLSTMAWMCCFLFLDFSHVYLFLCVLYHFNFMLFMLCYIYFIVELLLLWDFEFDSSALKTTLHFLFQVLISVDQPEKLQATKAFSRSFLLQQRFCNWLYLVRASNLQGPWCFFNFWPQLVIIIFPGFCLLSSADKCVYSSFFVSLTAKVIYSSCGGKKGAICFIMKLLDGVKLHSK